MRHVLSIVYRCIATHLIRKAGFSRSTAQTEAVTLVQRIGSALSLNVRFHMLLLDGVCIFADALKGLGLNPAKPPDKPPDKARRPLRARGFVRQLYAIEYRLRTELAEVRY